MLGNQRTPFSFLSPVVLNLLIINVLVWLASIVLPRVSPINLDVLLGLHYWQSAAFNPLQFISYMFMHGSFDHIFFNMFGLFMFGPVLEQVWGGKRFLFFYLFTGVGAGIVQELFWTYQLMPYIGSSAMHIVFQGGLEPITIGASGAIFGILLAFAMIFPDARLMLFFLPIPIKARYFVPMYALVELVLGVANFSGDDVAHFAHLGGALFGLILILYWKRRAKLN
ncbi:rhomboid family intramembrane serine protease [Microbacter margulisiae]|uniref:Membrane associated rhomboid family serine protease n=1 Tax=Microbacter margulisiae TaxID=1350067 RepID=A0A7W5H3K6_9PORP|nr:rhomboid family intramembrane serine protease [Microbacter margulisiae]MBB3188556.1 membrane associated rhomboid family serine protease [Microbacter margulisiae]